jgi:hypothetical protein
MGHSDSLMNAMVAASVVLLVVPATAVAVVMWYLRRARQAD